MRRRKSDSADGATENACTDAEKIERLEATVAQLTDDVRRLLSHTFGDRRLG